MLSMLVMAFIRFPPLVQKQVGASAGRTLSEIVRQPVFIVSTLAAALGYGVMNLLMAATPLAMQVCGLTFENTALVLEWHVIGMFAPGFFTGALIQRFGALRIMGVGVLLNAGCIVVALSGVELHQFVVALFLLGVGWNFLFTGSTTLSLQTYAPEEKDRAQAFINFFVFATMAVTSFASGALVTTQGWSFLNWGSAVPLALTGIALLWLHWHGRGSKAKAIHSLDS
jgi:MFS family permease